MSAQRNLSVDALRFVAAFGVIIIHLAPSTPAAEAFTRMFLLGAVPFFLSVSLHFFIRRVDSLPAFRLADLRLDRLLVPYAAWTLVYTVLRLLKLRLEGKPLTVDFVGVTLFGGAAVHLYFLPLLLLLQALALAVLLLRGAPARRLAGGCVALGAVVFGCAGRAGDFFGFQGALARGAAYVALVFLLNRVQAAALGPRINRVVGWLTVACVLSSAYLGFPLYALGPFVQGPVVGYGLCALALNVSLPVTRPVFRVLLTCSYGIYLAHFAFLETFEVAARKLGYVLTPYPVGTKIVMGGLIGVSCVLFVAVARLHRVPAYLLLGESRRP